MAKLPKSLIKKYGISKKAWSVFRSQKTTTRTGEKMARKGKHNRRGHSSSSGKLMDVVIPAGVGFGYGYIRQPIANMIPDFIGPYTDVAVLGGASALATIMIKNPMVKAVAKTILGIESYNASLILQSGNTSSSTNGGYV